MSQKSRAPGKRQRTSRGGLAWFTALSTAALALSIALIAIQRGAHAGAGPSFCSLGPAADCDRVAASPYAVFLGVPLAAWGSFAYGSMVVLALTGLRRDRATASWPAGFLLVFSGTAALATIPLALVSAFAIRSLCLLCAVTWAIDWALLGLALREASRAGGPAAALASDVHVLAARPRRSGAFAACGLAVLAVLVAVTRSPHADPAPASRTTPVAPPVATAPDVGVLTIVEYSDYQCPYCSRAHAEVRAAIANRPGIQLEHRNFPLDHGCNPIVQRPLHQEACALARAAMCAGDQGRFWQMNDALYANQALRRPIAELAAAAGLDVAEFHRCVDSPRTAERLAEEIASGVRAGVRATPTYAVGGALYAGKLPPQLFGAR